MQVDNRTVQSSIVPLATVHLVSLLALVSVHTVATGHLAVVAVVDVHRFVPGVPMLLLTLRLPPPSRHRIAADWILEIVDLIDAIFALSRADPKLTSTIAANIPMIAITINSSMRVNAFLYLLPLWNGSVWLFILMDANLGEGIFLALGKYKSKKFLNQICVVIKIILGYFF